MSSPLQLLFFISVILLAGCRHEEPNPEIFDPIYQDLVKSQKDSETELELEKKKHEEALVALERALPVTIELKNARKEVEKTTHNLVVINQRAHYARIRADRRLVIARAASHEAFINGKDWPPPEERIQYQTNRRLVTAPRNWAAHLPKLFDRKPTMAPKSEKAEVKEE
jgi:hypothetical protein